MTANAPRCARCLSALTVTLSDARLCPVCLFGQAMQRSEDELAPDAAPPYHTITVLARGVSSITYLATPIGTTRHVALKVVGPRSDVRDVVRRFERWRDLVSFTRYPGIARLLDVGPVTGQRLYLASEYVPGRSVGRMLAEGAINPAAGARIADQLEQALAALRTKGVAHMGLSAEHVRIRGEGRPCIGIIGFGQALVLNEAEPDTGDDEAVVRRLTTELRGTA